MERIAGCVPVVVAGRCGGRRAGWAASLLIGCGLLAGAAPALGAPLANGRFETPPIGGVQYVIRDAPFDFGDWKVTAGSVAQIGSLWAGADGGHSLQLASAAPGTLCQTFPASTTGNGRVTFTMSHNAGVASGQLEVLVDGVSAGTFTHNTPNSFSDMKWEVHSVAFPVAGLTTQLCFRATSSPPNYPVIDTVSLGGPLVRIWGLGGLGPLGGMAVDPSTGDVYLADTETAFFLGTPLFTEDFLRRATAAGTFVSLLESRAPGALHGVALDLTRGYVYVLESGTGGQTVVSKLTPAGGAVSTFGGFPRADAVAVDPASGNVYVTDVNGHALAKFAPDGTPLGTFTTAGSPVGVAVDPSTGDVYATVYETSEVQKFSANGTLLQTIGGPGSGAGMFNHPFGVAVDASNGDVYVGDAGNGVQRFTSRGVFLDQTPTGLAALALAVDPGTGVVYAGFGNGSVWLLGILPAISGSPTDGATVYASRASQVGRGPFTYSYQWLDCPPGGGACVNNGPPTSSNGLRLKPGDEGQTIEVAVTQTGAAGTVGPHTSAPIGPVLPSPPVNTVAPVISGSSADGSVLSATHGTWSGAPATSYSYVWQSCGGTCANVATNAAGYRLQPSDVGHTIKVLVAETNPDGTGGPVASSAVGPITASPPVNASPPTITGPYASGSRLTGQAGTWTGVLPITYAYQWQRCPDGTAATCTDIPGATLNSYVLAPADTHVRLVVKATNADGGPVTATSAIAG